MQRISIIITILLLVGCSVKNQVTRVEQADSIIKYQKNSTERSRFSNLYPKNKSYSVTCKENCYQAQENAHYL